MVTVQVSQSPASGGASRAGSQRTFLPGRNRLAASASRISRGAGAVLPKVDFPTFVSAWTRIEMERPGIDTFLLLSFGTAIYQPLASSATYRSYGSMTS